MCVMDWPSIQGLALPMTQERLQSHDPKTSTRENVWNRWMFSTVRVLVLPLSVTFFPTNVSSLIHVSKQNRSKAIHLLKDKQKEKNKNNRNPIWLAFQQKLRVWNNYYSIS